MQTILVPTDFSPGAYNAARYALALAKEINSSKVILYNAFEMYVADDPELGLPVQTDLEEFKQISENGLLKMQDELKVLLPATTELICESEYNVLANGVAEKCVQYNVDLIVMGITETESKLEEAIIGSSALSIAKENTTPVLIVPSKVTYSNLKKVLLALDFKKVEETTPVAAIRSLLKSTNAKLDILHVEADANETTEGFMNEQQTLTTLFIGYDIRFNLVKGSSVEAGINQFIHDNATDLLIVIPKKHGFFDKLFKPSHTKAFAFHSHIPVLTMHN